MGDHRAPARACLLLGDLEATTRDRSANGVSAAGKVARGSVTTTWWASGRSRGAKDRPG